MRKIGPRNPIAVRLTIIIGGTLLGIGVLVFAFFAIRNSNDLYYDIGQRNLSTIYHDAILQNYDDYVKFIKDYDIAIDLKTTDFASNDYIASFQEYDSCSESKQKVVTGVKISDKIDVDIKIYNKCGWCKSHMLLYLIKIDKVDNPNMEIKYHYTYNKDDLDCNVK